MPGRFFVLVFFSYLVAIVAANRCIHSFCISTCLYECILLRARFRCFERAFFFLYSSCCFLFLCAIRSMLHSNTEKFMQLFSFFSHVLVRLLKRTYETFTAL
ncbi:unnamed protein product [Ixodes pacificus]